MSISTTLIACNQSVTIRAQESFGEPDMPAVTTRAWLRFELGEFDSVAVLLSTQQLRQVVVAINAQLAKMAAQKSEKEVPA